MSDKNDKEVREEQKTENKNKKRKTKAKLLEPIDNIDDVPASHFSTDTTTMTIKRIMRMHEEHHIKFPKYQRGDVWSKEDQAELIESIIRGIPIPQYMWIVKIMVKNGKYLMVGNVKRLFQCFSYIMM